MFTSLKASVCQLLCETAPSLMLKRTLVNCPKHTTLLFVSRNDFPSLKKVASCTLNRKDHVNVHQHVCALPRCFSSVLLCEILWAAACQIPLSVGFSRQEYWSGLLCFPPGDLYSGVEPVSLTSPALTSRFPNMVPSEKPV